MALERLIKQSAFLMTEKYLKSWRLCTRIHCKEFKTVATSTKIDAFDVDYKQEFSKKNAFNSVKYYES